MLRRFFGAETVKRLKKGNVRMSQHKYSKKKVFSCEKNRKEEKTQRNISPFQKKSGNK